MSALPARETLRRGWCPSTLRPMQTGDGWLVRLHPPEGVLTPTQLARIVALARAHGNGLIEISGRGNLQLRGVSAATHPALVATLLAERLVAEHDGDGPQRLTLISPLVAVSPSQTGLTIPSLAAAIEAAGRGIGGLPAKTLVVMDDGGPASLDAVSADLRLRVVAGGIALGLPDGRWLGPVAPDRAVAAAASLLVGFAAHHQRAPDTVRRMKDLPPNELAALATVTGLPATSAPAVRPAPLRAGLFALADEEVVALIALPFGRCEAATLADLAEAAARGGATGLRLSPWRGLAFHGLPPEAATSLITRAQELGLIVRDDDPRLSVQACAGKPACTRAETDAMADAAILAEAAAAALAPSATLHVSGCVKSCAHPGPAALTLVGRAGGYDVVLGGRTRDRAVSHHDLAGLLAELGPGGALRAALAEGRQESRMSERQDYIRDGDAIYARSFAIIRAEADLSRFAGRAEHVVVRMIHACGMTDLPADVAMSADFCAAAEAALQAGAPILCDARMVADGVTRARLPAANAVICTLQAPETAGLAAQLRTTRSAAATELWRPHLAGALVVIGNAPTALFRLLEMLDEGVAKPAAVIGIPVGFVGAAESKQALAQDGRVPFLVVQGRRGGSAMAAAAVNALAQVKE